MRVHRLLETPPVAVTADAARPAAEVRVGVGACAGFALFYTTFFLPSLLTGNYLAPSDSLDFGLAAYLSPLTLWTEAMYSGYPIGADPQSMSWYLPLHLSRGLGIGWNAFMVMAYVLASTGAFLVVHRLTASRLAGIFAGLVYGYGGPMLAHVSHFNLIHAAAWLPFVVYGLLLTRQGHLPAGTLVGAPAFALMIQAGHPQIALYAAYLLAAATLGWAATDGLTFRACGTRALATVCLLGLGVALASVTVWPMLELAAHSTRQGSSWVLYGSKPLPPWQILTLVFPFSFGGFWSPSGAHVPYFGEASPSEMTGYAGLLPIGLTAIGPWLMRRQRGEALVWSLIALVALLLCLGPETPVGALFFHAPGYASFRVPARHLFFVSFAVAVASGVVLAQLTARMERRALASAVGGTTLLGLVCAALFAGTSPSVRDLVGGNADYLRWAVFPPLAIAGLLIVLALTPFPIGGGHSSLVLAGLLIAVHLSEMTLFHYAMPGYRLTNYAQVESRDLAPTPEMVALAEQARQAGQRLLAADGSGNPFLRPNLTRAWGLPVAGGAGSLGIAAYRRVLTMGGPGDVPDQVLHAENRGLDLFSIAYVLVPESWPAAKALESDDDRWTLVDHVQYLEDDPETQYAVFRNARARPHAWCVSETVAIDEEGAARAIREGTLEHRAFDPAATALVDHGGPRLTASPAGRAEVVKETVVRDQARRYRVEGSAPCLLLISEVYYPWWRASVDGEPIDVVRANLSMVAVPVSPGVHTVDVWLQPQSVWIGAAGSVAAMVCWLMLAGRSVRCGRVFTPAWIARRG